MNLLAHVNEQSRVWRVRRMQAGGGVGRGREEGKEGERAVTHSERIELSDYKFSGARRANTNDLKFS